MGQRLADQHLHGFIVHHVAGGVDQAVLAVGGKGVQGHIGDHAQFRKRVLEGAHRPLRQSLRIVGLARVVGFLFRRRDREQRQGRDAEIVYFCRFEQQFIDAQALDARHGGHRLAPSLAFQDEHRIDQIIDGQPVFAHQPPGKTSRRIRRMRVAGKPPCADFFSVTEDSGIGYQPTVYRDCQPGSVPVCSLFADTPGYTSAHAGV